jgi:predicted dehydrogenase
MTTPPLPIAIVGCGAIADSYAAAVDRSGRFVVAACVDPNPTARESLARRTHGLAVPDVDELDAAKFAAALVLAPPHLHEALSIRLLERGLHVLCEKPLAPTPAAARRMFAAASRTGRVLMMGSKFRYTPDVAVARNLLDSGVCGELVLYENVFCSHVDMSRRWNARPDESGGGVLIDNGCHSVDLARFLLGPIARVQAQFGRRLQPIEVEDTARMLFESEGGAIGTIDLSWSVHKETDAYVRIHGAAGTIEIGWRGSRWKATGGEWKPFGVGYDKSTAFSVQLRNFAGVIDGSEPPVIGDADALASVDVIDRAYCSAAERRWLEVAT